MQTEWLSSRVKTETDGTLKTCSAKNVCRMRLTSQHTPRVLGNRGKITVAGEQAKF